MNSLLKGDNFIPIIRFLTEFPNESLPSTKLGVTIKEIAEIISDYFGKEIVWDTTKPMGDMKRLMSMERANKYGFYPETSLKEGITKTIEWYKEKMNVLQG